MVLGVGALATAGFGGVATAASTPKAIPGATYKGSGAELDVDVTGKTVRVISLPVHARCKPKGPSNAGEFGASGLGPFTVAKDGTFTNVAKGENAGKNQIVVKGRFAGAHATGTVVVPPIEDTTKGFECAKYSGTWKAARVTGTGDTTKPGATYAKDDFRDAKSGFAVYNGDASYAEYLKDGRFRIGTRRPTAAVSLRDEPVTATADVSVTTGFTSGSGSDSVGIACAGTGPTSFIAGYVGLDGTAGLLRYADNEVVEQAPDQQVPAGLLKTGDQAQNDLRLVCTPSPDDAQRTDVTLFLDGKQVAAASASVAGAGKVGLFVGSTSGTSEFTFSDFVVRKPR
jgi:hypothetical protein